MNTLSSTADPRKKENSDSDASSSELEEGEIDERKLPPPPLKKPVSIVPPSSRRFRAEPSPRPRIRDPYQPEPKPAHFQSDSQQQEHPPIQNQPFPSVYPTTYSSSGPRYPFESAIQSNTIQCSPSYFPYPVYPPVYPVEPAPFPSSAAPIEEDDEYRYTAAEQSLQNILNLGITYNDLLAEGLHPKFLDRLFSRLQSPQVESRPGSLPTTPEPIDWGWEPRSPEHRASSKPPSLVADVENFLHTLEPSMSTTQPRGERRKRGGPVTGPTPKRRAFGLEPPKELVIDVSDDDSEDEDKEVKTSNLVKKEEESTIQPQASRPIVQPSERPPFKQKKDMAKSLRNRELAIEAMKRKIEAKMKMQGLSSNDGVVQEIATNIVDNADTPVVSPSVQTPEPTENWSPINVPVPSRSVPPTRQSSLNSEPSITTQQLDTEREESVEVDDEVDEEEGRLLAELEAERQAEEKARQKREELEDRLASARGKRIKRSRSALSERGGGQRDMKISTDVTPASISPTQDNFGAETDNSLSVDDDEPQDDEDEESMSIGDREDHLVDDDTAMAVDAQNCPQDDKNSSMVQSAETEPTKLQDMRYRYDSPMRTFGEFKYHPYYLAFVPTGGYRSLTYFNHLKPKKTLCPYELSGGICNDSSCKFQHFKTIILSDDDIIKDLLDEIRGEIPVSERGPIFGRLKFLLNEVGANSGNDFQTLVLTLVEFRKTRVINPPHLIQFP